MIKGLAARGSQLGIMAILVGVFAFGAHPAVASVICTTGATCTTAEVGPFMQGISKACGNTGDCTLPDLINVFENVGNWILAIIGSLVFLFYIYGGILYLSAGANPDNAKKGKQAFKVSTVGLIIVFLGFAAIQTLNAVLTGGELTTESNWVTCGPGAENSGKACGDNKICSEIPLFYGSCVTECEDAHQVSEGGEIWSCVNTADPFAIYNSSPACETGKCPGGDEIKCCQVRAAESP